MVQGELVLNNCPSRFIVYSSVFQPTCWTPSTGHKIHCEGLWDVYRERQTGSNSKCCWTQYLLFCNVLDDVYLFGSRTLRLFKWIHLNASGTWSVELLTPHLQPVTWEPSLTQLSCMGSQFKKIRNHWFNCGQGVVFDMLICLSIWLGITAVKWI